jgi:hypothetical protein
MDYKEKFSIRLKRHKDFFSSNQPGDILFCRGGSNFFPSFQHHWLNILQKRTLESIKKEDVIKINDDYLKQLRARYQEYYNIDDDGIPTIEVYFGIGTVTSAMSGKQPAFLSGRSWCGHILQRREDADILKFDYNNIILQLHLMVYQNMVDRWQGDYLLTPFMYRSPLDAAWGLGAMICSMIFMIILILLNN